MSKIEGGLIGLCLAAIIYGLFFGARTPPQRPQPQPVQKTRAQKDLEDYGGPGIIGSPGWTNNNGMPGMPGTNWK